MAWKVYEDDAELGEIEDGDIRPVEVTGGWQAFGPTGAGHPSPKVSQPVTHVKDLPDKDGNPRTLDDVLESGDRDCLLKNALKIPCDPVPLKPGHRYRLDKVGGPWSVKVEAMEFEQQGKRFVLAHITDIHHGPRTRA